MGKCSREDREKAERRIRKVQQEDETKLLQEG
jgi:hypothetical protein